MPRLKRQTRTDSGVRSGGANRSSAAFPTPRAGPPARQRASGDRLKLHSRPYVSLPHAQRAMRRMIREDSRLPAVAEWARKILGPAAPKRIGAAEAARRVEAALREEIAYVLDPFGNELLQDALATKTLGLGDCDDFTVASLALLRAAGFEGRIKSLALDPSRPDTYTHVLAQVRGPATASASSASASSASASSGSAGSKASSASAATERVWHDVDGTMPLDFVMAPPVKTRLLRI